MKIKRFNESNDESNCHVYDMKYFGTRVLYFDCGILDELNIEHVICYQDVDSEGILDFKLFVFCYNDKDADAVEKELNLNYYTDLTSNSDILEFKNELKKDYVGKQIKKEDIELLIQSKKFNI